MPRRRRRQRPMIHRLDRADLLDLLGLFEDGYEEAMGTRLESDEFYRLYRTGRLDLGPGTMAWATYYEALMRLNGAQETDPVAAVEEALQGVGVA